MIKLLNDLLMSPSALQCFYEADLRVLLEIATREVHDLCPAEPLRVHFLRLIKVILPKIEAERAKIDIEKCVNNLQSPSDCELNVITAILHSLQLASGEHCDRSGPRIGRDIISDL